MLEQDRGRLAGYTWRGYTRNTRGKPLHASVTMKQIVRGKDKGKKEVPDHEKPQWKSSLLLADQRKRLSERPSPKQACTLHYLVYSTTKPETLQWTVDSASPIAFLLLIPAAAVLTERRHGWGGGGGGGSGGQGIGISVRTTRIPINRSNQWKFAWAEVGL